MRTSLLTLALIPLLLTAPLAAAPDDQAQEYQRCLRLAKQRPDDGYEESLAWASLGGGEPAKHCMALARIGQKQYADGARRLEALARDSRQSTAMRADMLSQAAQAWILDDNWEMADADQRTALILNPDQPDILVDHAITLGQVHHYQDALDDLNRALQLRPNRVDALVLRASAKRFLNDLSGARTDIDAALAINADDWDGLLERGILRRLSDDPKGARADWMRLLELNPNGPAADTARRNLELLDVDQKK